MEDFNKIISFVLGLIVVVVFILVITGRLNFKKRLSFLASNKPTPTVILTPTPATDVHNYATGTITGTPSSKTTPTQKGTTSNQSGNGSIAYINDVSPSPAGQSGQLTTIPTTGVSSWFIPAVFASLMLGFFLKGAKQNS